MSQKVNYYHLTKKELSFISSIQEPLVYSDKRLSRPVVVATFLPTGRVSRVFTLSWFRRMVKRSEIDLRFYSYDIYAMF